MLKRKNKRQKTKSSLFIVTLQFQGDIQKSTIQRENKKGYWCEFYNFLNHKIEMYFSKDNLKNYKKHAVNVFIDFEEAKECYVSYLKDYLKKQQKRVREEIKLSEDDL